MLCMYEKKTQTVRKETKDHTNKKAEFNTGDINKIKVKNKVKKLDFSKLMHYLPSNFNRMLIHLNKISIQHIQKDEREDLSYILLDIIWLQHS